MDQDDRTQALQRLHILDAVWIALERRAEFMDLVDASENADDAVGRVRDAFDFDEVQAIAVLDLQMRRFARLERTRIAREREALRREVGRE